MLRPEDGNVRSRGRVTRDLAPKSRVGVVFADRNRGEGGTMRKALAAATTMLLMLVIAGGAAAVEGSRYEEAVRSRGGVVASESTAASEAGLATLDAGGNAMDAAATMTFALGVARPQSCGIGGGGFLVYRGADGENATLDFRETAPAAV